MKTQKGFGLIGILITLVIVVGIAGGSFYALQNVGKVDSLDGEIETQSINSVIEQAEDVKQIVEDRNTEINDVTDADVVDKNNFIEIGKEYLQAGSPVAIGDKLAYVVNDGERNFIIYDGQEIGKEYSLAKFPWNLDGKLAYYAANLETKPAEFFIVYNSQEFGKGYQSVDKPTIVNGQLAFQARSDKPLIYYNGREFGKEYDSAFFPISINNNLVYVASKGGKRFIVSDGNKIGKEYDNIRIPIKVNNELAFEAMDDGKEFIVYDGKEIGKEYSSASEPVEINGKLAFVAVQNNKNFVIYDGKKVDYTESNSIFISDLIGVDGKIAYIAFDINSREKYVNYERQEIGKEYGEVFYITAVGSKLVMNVKGKDGKIFIVMEK